MNAVGFSCCNATNYRVSLFDKKVDFSVNVVEDLLFPVKCIAFYVADKSVIYKKSDQLYVSE